MTMDTVFTITSLLFFSWIVVNTLFWLSLFEKHDFHFFSVIQFFLQTRMGRNLLFSPVGALKLTAIGVYIYAIFHEEYFQTYQYSVFLVYLLQLFDVIRMRHSYFSFKIRSKTLILVLTLFISFIFILLYSVPFIDRFVWFIFMDKSLPFFVAFIVFAVSVPLELLNDFYLEKIGRENRMKKRPLVICVATSMANPQVFFYMKQVLSTTFVTIEIDGWSLPNWQSAKAYYDTMGKKTDIICMQYNPQTRLEFLKLCEMIHPDYIIVPSSYGKNETNIPVLSLLLKTVAENGTILIENLYEQPTSFQNIQRNKTLFYTVYPSEVLALDIGESRETVLSAFITAMRKKHTEFTLQIRRKEYLFSTNLLGFYAITHLIPCIFIALRLGIKKQTVRKSIEQLQLVSMIPHEVTKNRVIIDDTQNRDARSILATLSYIKLYKKKRFFVLSSLKSFYFLDEKLTEKIVKLIATICDYVFLSQGSDYQKLSEALVKTGGSCAIIKEKKKKHIMRFLREYAKQGDIIVFEGNEVSADLIL